MSPAEQTKDNPARKAARAMLMEGIASPSEVAELAGVSRQLVNFWMADLDWRKARETRLAKEWRARLRSTRV